MGAYNIGFLAFCIILVSLILIGVSKNVLTNYGAGILIGILVFGIIGYDIWANRKAQELMREIDLAVSDTEKQMLIQKFIKYFGIPSQN
jgi:hypothetical protein